MQVTVYNDKGEKVDTILNVDDIKSCEDGRIIIHHFKNCPHCGVRSGFNAQVPKGYSIRGGENE